MTVRSGADWAPAVPAGILRHCEFSGAVAARGPLSWAQQFMWQVVSAQRGNHHRLDLFVDVPVERVLAVDEALDAIRRLVMRHPTLRTRVCTGEDKQLYQEVLSCGMLPVVVVEVSSTRAVGLREAVPYVDDTLLVRGLIATREGMAVRVLLRLNHMVADGWGVRLLCRDLAAAMAGGNLEGVDEENTTSQGKSAVDLAEWEASPAGGAVRAAGLKHTTDQLSAAPQAMFPHPLRRGEQPRYWDAELSSAALYEALAALVAGHTMFSAAVIGAFAAILAARAGTPSALIYVIAHNRFDRAWADVSAPTAQEAVLCVPATSRTLRELLALVNPAAVKAFRYGRHDPVGRAAETERIEWERGIWLDKIGRSAVLNIRSATTPVTQSPVSKERLRALAGSTVFSWGDKRDIDDLALYLEVVVKADTVVLSARADTRLIGPTELEAILRGMETLLVTVATEDVPLADLMHRCPGIGRSFGRPTMVVQGSRISLVDCREALVAVPCVVDADVYVGQDALLSADVVAPGITDVRLLHRAVLDRLPGHPLAMAPHIYRLYAHRPAGSCATSDWQGASPLLVGTGR